MKAGNSEDRREFFRRVCHAYGLRVTPQREAIFLALGHSDRHPTAEQLHLIVQRRFPGLSLDTVNRTLLTFAEIGLADIVEGQGSPRRYDHDLGPHHHAHCIRCGRIVDFQDAGYDALGAPSNLPGAFTVLRKRVVLSGICGACQTKQPKKRTATTT